MKSRMCMDPPLVNICTNNSNICHHKVGLFIFLYQNIMKIKYNKFISKIYQLYRLYLYIISLLMQFRFVV